MPTEALTGGGIPASELTPQGYLEMAQAKAAAKTAALRRLGYSIPEHNAGAVVAAVGSGTPAFKVLQVGQVITAVDGASTPTLCAFVGALSHLAPGQTVHLRVALDHFTADGTPVAGAAVTRSLRLAPRPTDIPGYSGCPGVGASKGFLGVSLETQQDFTFPFPITINTADIGGPSAGLAMTLGLINTLSGGHLTRGQHRGRDRHHGADRRRRGRRRGGPEDRRGRAGGGHGVLRAAPRAGGRTGQGHPLAAGLRRLDAWPRRCRSYSDSAGRSPQQPPAGAGSGPGEPFDAGSSELGLSTLGAQVVGLRPCRTPPTASSARLRPDEVTRRSFTRNRRGFDPAEVVAYLEELSAELRVVGGRARRNCSRELVEAEERAANPEIDDARLTSALGQKSAELLRNAHEEASRLVNAAEETAAAVVRDAQQQATDIQVSAEAAAAERIAQAELSAGAVHEDVQADVAAILERARTDGSSLLDRARERGRLMIEQAQETRQADADRDGAAPTRSCSSRSNSCAPHAISWRAR